MGKNLKKRFFLFWLFWLTCAGVSCSSRAKKSRGDSPAVTCMLLPMIVSLDSFSDLDAREVKLVGGRDGVTLPAGVGGWFDCLMAAGRSDGQLLACWELHGPVPRTTGSSRREWADGVPPQWRQQVGTIGRGLRLSNVSRPFFFFFFWSGQSINWQTDTFIHSFIHYYVAKMLNKRLNFHFSLKMYLPSCGCSFISSV